MPPPPPPPPPPLHLLLLLLWLGSLLLAPSAAGERVAAEPPSPPSKPPPLASQVAATATAVAVAASEEKGPPTASAQRALTTTAPPSPPPPLAQPSPSAPRAPAKKPRRKPRIRLIKIYRKVYRKPPSRKGRQGAAASSAAAPPPPQVNRAQQPTRGPADHRKDETDSTKVADRAPLNTTQRPQESALIKPNISFGNEEEPPRTASEALRNVNLSHSNQSPSTVDELLNDKVLMGIIKNDSEANQGDRYFLNPEQITISTAAEYTGTQTTSSENKTFAYPANNTRRFNDPKIKAQDRTVDGSSFSISPSISSTTNSLATENSDLKVEDRFLNINNEEIETPKQVIKNTSIPQRSTPSTFEIMRKEPQGREPKRPEDTTQNDRASTADPRISDRTYNSETTQGSALRDSSTAQHNSNTKRSENSKKASVVVHVTAQTISDSESTSSEDPEEISTGGQHSSGDAGTHSRESSSSSFSSSSSSSSSPWSSENSSEGAQIYSLESTESAEATPPHSFEVAEQPSPQHPPLSPVLQPEKSEIRYFEKTDNVIAKSSLNSKRQNQTRRDPKVKPNQSLMLKCQQEKQNRVFLPNTRMFANDIRDHTSDSVSPGYQSKYILENSDIKPDIGETSLPHFSYLSKENNSHRSKLIAAIQNLCIVGNMWICPTSIAAAKARVAARQQSQNHQIENKPIVGKQIFYDQMEPVAVHPNSYSSEIFRPSVNDRKVVGAQIPEGRRGTYEYDPDKTAPQRGPTQTLASGASDAERCFRRFLRLAATSGSASAGAPRPLLAKEAAARGRAPLWLLPPPPFTLLLPFPLAPPLLPPPPPPLPPPLLWPPPLLLPLPPGLPVLPPGSASAFGGAPG